MKVKVHRQLDRGVFKVGFEVGDFTEQERAKMASFGVPRIQIKDASANQNIIRSLPIDQINLNWQAAFGNEESARQYEAGVLQSLRSAIDEIRAKEDVFSSAEEVEL